MSELADKNIKTMIIVLSRDMEDIKGEKANFYRKRLQCNEIKKNALDEIN